jgi:hypothetical protein
MMKVKVCSGLVKKEHWAILGECAGQQDSLLLTAREFIDSSFSQVFYTTGTHGTPDYFKVVRTHAPQPT